MEEKEIMPGIFKISSYFKKLWKKKTALILSSFFGVPFVLPSASRSAFILMDDTLPCSTDKQEKASENARRDPERCFYMERDPYFGRSLWFHPVFDFIFPGWGFYTIPSFFRWFFREHGVLDRNERETRDFERYRDFLWRPRLFHDEIWKDAFETFEELRTKEIDNEEVFENKNEYKKGKESSWDESSKKVTSTFSKKMLRTFGDGSYETIEIIKRCFDDGTCETTKYTDSSNGKYAKKGEILDNKVQSPTSTCTEESAFHPAIDK
ncbi:hypothetical protein PNEG_01540 [Pneumocystis murina B123]|uniref:Uncharacterized protein n=1 Tax=Pneumocystis murina (strain B123) TaxID=1069680 RepID=M7NT83_PNEMU|nr:hypothetical protein PNEG_01540 [Pneumocystis murina B123]EMR10276.1 hypothetical protein PNEG_01540 [Pneumocystis murina B123]